MEETSEIMMSEEKILPSMNWRQMTFNPAIFQVSQKPPFTVPVEQLNSWTVRNEKNYMFWLDKGSTYTKDDYRQFVLSMNTEFNMEDVFDRIDLGLEAFEKLVDFMKNFPKYNLNKDVELMYPK